MNGENVMIEDLDATQPMLSTSSPSQIDTGTPLRRISSLSSLTNVSPIDLTQSSPEERVSPEEKRGRFQTSPDRRHSSSLSRLWPRDFSDKNSSGVTNSENVDLDNSNDLEVQMASMTTTEYIESHVKDKAGDKPRTNKRRIGGGASQKTHSTVVVRTNPGTPAQLMAAAQAQTRSVPPKLSNGSKDKPTPAQHAKLFERKEIVCTERWHNKPDSLVM